MAFDQYPDNLAVVVCDDFDSNHIIDLGFIDPDEDQQLAYFGVQIFKRGLQPNVSMTVVAYDSITLIGTSEPVLVSTIESEYPDTANFYGWVRFSFDPRMNLNNGTTTSFSLILSNYVYSANVFIGAVKDWPTTMGFNTTVTNINDAPFAIELYGAV